MVRAPRALHSENKETNHGKPDHQLVRGQSGTLSTKKKKSDKGKTKKTQVIGTNQEEEIKTP